MRKRSYHELEKIEDFKARFEYLKLDGQVGRATFGFDRYLNQAFYQSSLWKEARRFTIIRDNGCDLGVPGFEIHANLLVHHMNPVSMDDILEHADWLVDPDYLITTTHSTHNAIHYGNSDLLVIAPKERRPGDTKLW